MRSVRRLKQAGRDGCGKGWCHVLESEPISFVQLFVSSCWRGTVLNDWASTALADGNDWYYVSLPFPFPFPSLIYRQGFCKGGYSSRKWFDGWIDISAPRTTSSASLVLFTALLTSPLPVAANQRTCTSLPSCRSALFHSSHLVSLHCFCCVDLPDNFVICIIARSP